MAVPVDIEFVVGGDYKGKLGDVKAGIAGVGGEAEAAARKMRQQLDESRAAVKQLERDIAQLERSRLKVAPGRESLAALSEISAAKKALDEEKLIAAELERQLKSATQATVSFRAEQLRVVEQLRRMRQAGQENTAEYEALKQKLGELATIMRTTAAESRQLSTGGSLAAGMASGVSGVTGAMSALAGAMGVANAESKEFAALQTRIQSLLAITIGMQQVATTLHQTSAFRINIVAQAKKAWAAAVKVLNVQLGISVALSKALMAGGVGLLIAGVGLLVQKLMELRSQQDEVIRQDNLYVQIGKEANAVTAKRIAEIETLRAALRSGNVAYDDKIKALERLKSIIPGYSAELEKTGRLVGENTKKVEEYIAALNKQAYAQAAQQRLAEAYNRKLDVELKMRDLQEQKKEVDAITAWDASAPAIGVDRSGLHGGLPAAIAEARTESRRLAAEIEPLDKQLKEVMAEIWGINMLIDENVDTLMLGVSGKKKDNAGAAAAEASELKAQEELQRLLRDVHGRTEKLRLELQEDGLRKRLAALDLEREQELAKIEERNRAIVAAYNKKNPKAKVSGIEGVDPQAAAAQKEAIAEMVAEWDKASEKIVADFARKQGDLADRRREVEEQYQRDIDELEKRNADGRYSEAIRSAEQTRDMELGKLDEQLITESGMWQRLFGDIESVSLRETAAIAARLREMVLSIADPEVKRRLTQMLDEVEDKVSSSGRAIERMFGNSKGAGVANLFFGEGDLSSKLSAFNDVFKGAEGSMEGAAEASGEMSDSAGKAAGAMSAAGSSASGTVAIVDAIIKNVHGAIQGVREVMAAIAEYRAAIGKDDSDSSFGQAMAFMENLGEFDEKVFSGWEKLKSGNVMGAITDNFLAYYELFTESARSAAAAREELEQYNRQQFLAEHEIERIAEERKVVEDEISKSRLQVIDAEKGLLSLKGADAKARAQETIALLKEQQYIAGKEEVKHKTKIFDGHFGSWSEVKNVMGDLSAYLSAANGDLGETVRLLEAIKKRGGLSDAQKDLLEDLKADYELALRYEEDLAKAQEERRELLTGTTRDGLLDGLKSGLSEGKKAFADFAGGAEDVLREALLSAVAAGVGGDELEKLYEELYSAVADGSFTEKEVEKFKAGYAQIGENMGKALEAINQAGIDVTGGDASLTGAVKTITEQTASLMAGQLNGIRVNVARQLEAAGQILAQVQQIRAATDEYLPFLEAISEGVARLNSGPESQTRAA